MAKYGSDVFKVEFDDNAAALQNMSQYVDEINGFDIEAMLQESHTFGDAWVEQLFTGVKKVGEVTLSGFYDDTAATGPDVIFNAVGNTTTRTLKLTFGSTKTVSVECVIKNYRRLGRRGELTRYEVVLAPTGAVTET